MAPIQTTSDALSVEGENARSVLQRAADLRAKIRIKRRGVKQSGRIDGCIVEVNENHLTVSVPDHTVAESESTNVCDATLSMPEGIYLFRCEIAGGSTPPGGKRIRISTPDALRLIERRRFVRARLSPSTVVHVTVGSSVIDGVLLNLSEEGVACRVDADQVSALSVGGCVSIRFKPPPAEQAFDLPAVVSRKTRGAMDDNMVVAFVFGDGRDALQARRHIRNMIGESQSIELQER